MIEPKWNFWDIFCAVVARLIFSLHCIVAAWKVVKIYDNPVYYVVLLGVIGIVVEGIYFVFIKKANFHFKWVRPCVLFYLTSIVPSVWLLELKMYEIRINIRNEFENASTNFVNVSTYSVGSHSLFMSNTALTPMEMTPRPWVNALEQLMLFILIVARWLLPKGDVVKDYIPLLLMVFLGMAADIIQYFETAMRPTVRYNSSTLYGILCMVTLSLIPFILVPTVASRSSPMTTEFGKTGTENEKAEGDNPSKKECCPQVCQSPEILGILATLLLQDTPFLIFRCILMVNFQVHSYMTVFFAIKNALTIGILLYRMAIIFIEGSKKKDYSEIDDPGDMGY